MPDHGSAACHRMGRHPSNTLNPFIPAWQIGSTCEPWACDGLDERVVCHHCLSSVITQG